MVLTHQRFINLFFNIYGTRCIHWDKPASASKIGSWISLRQTITQTEKDESCRVLLFRNNKTRMGPFFVLLRLRRFNVLVKDHFLSHRTVSGNHQQLLEMN